MTWRDAIRPQSVAVDSLLLLALVAGANLLLDRAHPGWVNLNPSPYLLVPVLLGGRYGFTVGLLAGAATSLLVAGGQAWVGTGSMRASFAATPYHHVSFLFAGGICGELFAWFRRERLQSEAQRDKLQTSVRRLDADVRYLRGVKDELDRTVAARDGEVSVLDAELRRLYACPADELPGAVLQFLKRQVRLADAALYTVTEDTAALTRQANVGREIFLPPSFDRTQSALVKLALERGSLVTLPEILRRQDPPKGENILLAAPLLDARGKARAILIVTGLPFITFTAQTANLIALICEWAGEALDLANNAVGRYRVIPGRVGQRVFTREHFHHLTALALHAYQSHRLPSSVVVFTLPGAPGTEQSRFEQVLLGAIRAGDYAAELDRPEPHLAVLLPLVGERGTAIFVERCRQFLRQAGPWPVEPAIRRVEFGHTDDLRELTAQIDGAAPDAP